MSQATHASDRGETALRQWLAPFEPKLPIDELVVEVNRLFHDFEAANYDRRHPEVLEQLPPLWQAMAQQAVRLRPQTKWRILDFGCGTGFEALQLLNALPTGSIESLTCYDLSPGMIEVCRDKVAPRFSHAQFTTSLEQLKSQGKTYNLLATNSLLHHLPDAAASLAELESLLEPTAVWLTGHEPSNRFYRNADCLAAYERFHAEQSQRRVARWSRRLQPRYLAERLQRLWRGAASPKRQTADRAFELGWFGRRPPGWLIDRLVDRHVAHSADEASAGRGLDFEVLAREFSGRWKLAWHQTYSYMGATYEGRLPRVWQAQCGELARRYPNDGANFCTLWQRAA
jgi:ubiquinone/menaquinone biosynthesis C-methylase UbiE